MDSTCNYKQLVISFTLLSGYIKTELYPQNFLLDSDNYYQELQDVSRVVCRIIGLIDGMCDFTIHKKLKNQLFFAKAAWNYDSLAGAEYLLSLYETGGLEVLNPIHKIPIKKEQLSTIPSNKVKSPKKYQLRNVNFQITQPPK
jgi:hypothetical protein